jgi:glycosyltransferase involved in cell wall biosynthesis
LKSIEGQTFQPIEILIVDASETILESSQLASLKLSNVKIIPSQPSVCIQRNIGIQQAKGDYILLCDDDIIFPENYLMLVLSYAQNTKNKVVTGLWHQLESDGEWHVSYPPGSFWDLLFRFIFGLSIWGNVSEVPVNKKYQFLYKKIRAYYEKKGNRTTRAGWPLNTNFKEGIVKVKVTSLGAALIESNWLKSVPFEEVLDPYGIGDNYGVCMQLPEKEFIHVLPYLPVYHHKSAENRLKSNYSYFRRGLALHFFLKSLPQFKSRNYFFFYWSCLGTVLKHVLVFDKLWLKASYKILYLAISGKNPYVLGRKANQKIVIPKLD